MIRRSLPSLLLASTVLFAGCHGAPPIPTPEHEKAAADQQATLNIEQQQLSMIPPPSKARYMAIHTIDSWENPYLTVQPDMLTLHITLADANPSQIGAGGMMRPTGARRQQISIRFDKLEEGMVAIPQNSWPYGRVVAIEEAHKIPTQLEPATRRAVENVISRLNNLGLVVYDPTEGALR